MNFMEYSVEQLADRWMAQRELQNLMGKYVYYGLLRKEGDIFETFWCSEHEPCLGVNEGYYKGAEAVRGYYDAIHRNTEIRTGHMKKLFPDYLGKKSAQEAHGVGSLYIDALSGCVVEVAGDGETAKGLWSVMGMDSDLYEMGPYSFWGYGVIKGDFINEDGEWKIWHLQQIDDIYVPAGMNWADDWKTPEALPEFEALSGLGLPAPNVPETIREKYRPGRKNGRLAEIPRPYGTFSETFSYGV